MSVQEAIKEALEMPQTEKSELFKKQIERYEEFKRQLDAAGVVQNKKTFSIPLIERIGSSTFSK